jgi:hypothetical protein
MLATDIYPLPNRPLKAICDTCREAVAGGVRGSANFRYMLKSIKRHEDDHHPPYDKDIIIRALIVAVEEIGDGSLDPHRVGRYRVQPW